MKVFNGKLRNECLNGELLYTVKEAQVVIENWRKHYNTKPSHSSLGYKPSHTTTHHQAGEIDSDAITRQSLHQNEVLLLYRWMIEEYRVSLFAQTLGTVVSVSPKKLKEQLNKV